MDETLWGTLPPEAAKPEPTDWNGTPLAPRIESINPCIRQFGFGTEGVTCKGCRHLLRDGYHNQTYLKCDLRKLTRGAGSDHRASWPSCARYEAKNVITIHCFFRCKHVVRSEDPQEAHDLMEQHYSEKHYK